MQRALALLGLATTSQLVAGLLLRQAFPVGNSAALERYWAQSSLVASLSSVVARELRTGDRDVTRNFGLFRD